MAMLKSLLTRTKSLDWTDCPHVVLIGDSVLDDFCWTEEHSLCLDRLMKSELGAMEVSNLAMDLITAKEIVYGFSPDKYYMEERRKKGVRYLSEGIDPSSGEIRPLNCLVPLRKKCKKDKRSMLVLLSLGNVDMRQYLELAQPDLICDSLRKAGFISDYSNIVRRILEDTNGAPLVLVFPFEFHESLREDMLLFSRDDLLEVMGFVFNSVAKVAEEYHVPLIDLSRTMHPFERDHYGQSACEPSAKGATLLIKVVEFVLNNHSFPDYSSSTSKVGGGASATGMPASKIYFGTADSSTGIVCEDNNKKSRLGYVTQLQKTTSLDRGESDMHLLSDLFGSGSSGAIDVAMADMCAVDSEEFLSSMFSDTSALAALGSRSSVAAGGGDEKKSAELAAAVTRAPSASRGRR